jgi:hypothetical protein
VSQRLRRSLVSELRDLQKQIRSLGIRDDDDDDDSGEERGGERERGGCNEKQLELLARGKAGDVRRRGGATTGDKASDNLLLTARLSFNAAASQGKNPNSSSKSKSVAFAHSSSSSSSTHHQGALVVAQGNELSVTQGNNSNTGGGGGPEEEPEGGQGRDEDGDEVARLEGEVRYLAGRFGLLSGQHEALTVAEAQTKHEASGLRKQLRVESSANELMQRSQLAAAHELEHVQRKLAVVEQGERRRKVLEEVRATRLGPEVEAMATAQAAREVLNKKN